MLLPENTIEVRLAGDIKPETLSATELAELLKEVEGSLLPIVAREKAPESKEEVFISLVDIGHSSVGLRFRPSYYQQVAAALSILTHSIIQSSFSDLPSNSVKSLKEISAFSKKKKCVVEFRDKAGTQTPIAVITPDTEIPDIEIVYLEGETTIFGKIVRVGGLDKPTVHVRLSEDDTLVCNVRADLAVELGHRLYSWVGLSGIARWRQEDKSIDHFRVERLTDYEDTPLAEAFNDLASISSQYYQGVKDVIAYVHKLRGDRGD